MRGIGGAENPVGTNGEPYGTDGLAIGWGLSAAVIAAVCAINVLTLNHEAPQLGVYLPAVLEGSSALLHISLGWLPWLVLRHGRPLLHLPAAIVYSAVHVGGFIVLREATLEAYAFQGLSHWVFYELWKDVLVYGLMATAYWLIRRLRERPTEPPVTFDIRDGARIVRAPLADILAVTSAGNYAEFILADGRRPLMRSPLSALELPGFVRTHRSWLVNAARVTGLKPQGSSDYLVELGTLEVPLSRRFPEALTRLRAGTDRSRPPGP